MNKSIVEDVAVSTGLGGDIVLKVADELLLQLHRRLFEYRGLNGDYIGEKLPYEFNSQGFYHLLGFLEVFSGRYDWEPGTADEYLLRLGSIEHWAPYGHQTDDWVDRRKPS